MTRLAFIIIGFGLLAACEPNRTFERNISIPSGEWQRANPVELSISISDTTAAYSMYLTVRHTTSYPFSNLWLNIKTTYPSGNSGTLREQVYLGDNQEMRWKGDCIRDICLVQIPVVEGHRFSEEGEYHFTIEHIMRTNPLPDILDIGLRIEKQGN